MKRISLLIATILMLLVTAPCAFADFAVTPTLDLAASSNLAGATDAVYTFHFENTDTSTAVVGFSLAIPAGYSVNPAYITNETRITVMTGSAGQLFGFLRGQITVATTSTPRYYIVAISGYEFLAVLAEPTATAQGKFEVSFPSVPGDAVFMELSTLPGFFVNPSTPGNYTWGRSLANPESGSAVAMVPRSGFTQTVTIIGPSVATQAATTMTSETTAVTTTPELSAPEWRIPGFPIESILAGLMAGMAVLAVLRQVVVGAKTHPGRRPSEEAQTTT
jgi:hypothetical protein